MSTPARAVHELFPADLELPEAAVDRLVLRARLRARRRAAWLRRLWRQEHEVGQARAVSHAEVDASLEGWDEPAQEEAWWTGDEAMRPVARALARLEAAMAADREGRYFRLERLFDLDPQESDLLQACLVVRLDPSLARAFSYLQDHVGRPYPTEDLVARLYGHGARRVLRPESPLRRWALVVEEAAGPGEPRALACDPQIRDFLLGERHLDEALVGVARLVPPLAPLPRWPVEALAARLAAILDHEGAQPARVRVRVVGLPGSGRRTFAAAACAELGLPLLVVDADAVEDADWARVYVRAERQAYLDGCALGWTGERALARAWPTVVPGFPVQFVIAEGAQVPAPLPGVLDESMELPQPTVVERAALWQKLVPASAAWPADAVTALASRHRLALGEIAALGRQPSLTAEAASERVREASRGRLGDLARFVECPFGWGDLVVPASLAQVLADFVYEAEARAAFWEEPAPRRLFPQGRGLFALFSGPPGTGKTMAAQVVAAHLGLDLFRISLATVVSKYVGETSKNLDRILARAEQMDTVLLFDEADALFGRRTEIKDAHDRFANTDTNYLLQAIESYRGIALLSTNKKANIDPAFMRRLRYVLEFPKPDADTRRELWRRFVGELAGEARVAAIGPRLDQLAATVDVTGAQIKYAVLAALFAARREDRPLAPHHLLRGLDRELLKEGRALSDRDRESLGAP